MNEKPLTERKACRIRQCEEPRFRRLSLCEKHYREKKRAKLEKARYKVLAAGKLRKRLADNASALKGEALSVYGSVCVDCGEPQAGQLQLDHVENNGHQHRLIISKGRAGADFYRALKALGWPNKEPYKLEVRCFDCHVHKTNMRRFDQ